MKNVYDSWCILPTQMGEFRMYDSGDERVRIVSFGDLRELGTLPLVRVHSSCIASEVFGARDCDCADQLRESMTLVATEGRGLILHLHQEGRGHGLSLKIKAVGKMQRERRDTVEALDDLGLEQDTRSYEDVVRLLRILGISSIRLISNNPRKVGYLEQHGVGVTLVNTHPTVRPENAEYLRTKKDKLGHELRLEAADDQQEGPIHFYHSLDPGGFLSNFSQHAIFIGGREWPTVEHFYQAQKLAGTPHEEAIRGCGTPAQAKKLATSLAKELGRQDWASAKESIMLEALRAKFGQHPDLAEKLLRTGDQVLVERTGEDAYWGDGGDGSGQNRLGRLLMQVRSELRRTPDVEPSAN